VPARLAPPPLTIIARTILRASDIVRARRAQAPIDDLEPVAEQTPGDIDELAVRVAQTVAGL